MTCPFCGFKQDRVIDSRESKEGDVIRHNLGWTLFMLAYLVVIAVAFYLLRPASMTLPHG